MSTPVKIEYSDDFGKTFVASDKAAFAILIEAEVVEGKGPGWKVEVTCRAESEPTSEVIQGLVFGAMDQIFGDGAIGNYVKIEANVGAVVLGLSACEEAPQLVSLSVEGLGRDFTPQERITLLREALAMEKEGLAEDEKQ